MTERSCKNCQFCVKGYEHSLVCDVGSILIYDPKEMAKECKYYQEYNRWVDYDFDSRKD